MQITKLILFQEIYGFIKPKYNKGMVWSLLSMSRRRFLAGQLLDQLLLDPQSACADGVF